MSDIYKEDSPELKSLFASVDAFSVTFLDTSNENICAFGSGTLCDFGLVSGIVTCAHVLDRWRKIGRAGIATHSHNSQNRHFPIEQAHDDIVLINSGNRSKNGPDLGFLRLSSQVRDLVKSRSSFLNGNERSAHARSGEPNSNKQFDFVIGSVEEFNTKERLDGELNFRTRTLLNHGYAATMKTRGDYDYCIFQPGSPEPPLTLPASYGATSGGGLWRFYFSKSVDGSLSFVDRRFSGVAFYETGGTPREIVCHGPRSVFSSMRKKLQEKWPEARGKETIRTVS